MREVFSGLALRIEQRVIQQHLIDDMRQIVRMRKPVKFLRITDG